MTALAYSTSKEGTFVKMRSKDKNFVITNDEIKKRKNDLFPNLLLESSEKRKGRQAWGPAFFAYVLHLIPSKVADHNIAEYLLHTSDRSHPTS